MAERERNVGEAPASEIRAFVSPRSEEADRVVTELRERDSAPEVAQRDRLAHHVGRMLSKR